MHGAATFGIDNWPPDGVSIMTIRVCRVFTLVLLISARLAWAEIAIISETDLANAKLSGRNASVQQVDVVGQPFKLAQRVTVTEASDYGYSVQLTIDTPNPIKADDIALIRFRARTIDSKDVTGEGRVLAFFQKVGPPYSKSAYQLFSVSREWTTFELPFKSFTTADPGGTQLAFGFGACAQTIEIASPTVINYGANHDINALPRTRLTYPGREADAPWRAEAAARIEKHRKADLAVIVLDAAGNPVPDADVRVEMTKHAYWFGAAVYTYRWAEQSPTGERFRAEILRNFNHVMPENSLKWQALEGDYGPGARERTKQFVKWAKENGLHTHGHVLVWPGKAYMPKAYAHLLNKDRAPELRKAINDHIRRTIADFKPGIDEWQVVNELWGNRDFTNILGEAEVAEWFKLAHELYPEAPLYINDYGIIDEYLNERSPHLAAYEKTISDLLAQGVPISGIGSQSHFGTFATPPETIYVILERLGRFGLPIQTTEFDVHIRDEDLQADYLRDYLTMFFSHPSTVGFAHWGFWEGQHWKPFAALLRKDFSEKPNMKVWRDLVYNQWWTRKSLKTDATGRCATRGFLGDYRISVGDHHVTATLGRDGHTLTVRMPGKK
jgi:GH35 family endo-1,4-beta-xylanase